MLRNVYRRVDGNSSSICVTTSRIIFEFVGDISYCQRAVCSVYYSFGWARLVRATF